MDSHPLKTLLQLQLASDGNAVLHLPYILSNLTQEAFEPSSHLQKWTTRINSLIHAKDGGARWAGLCIAYRTSVLSKPIMLECAQSWVTASLSLIAKNENLPVLKACIRLLRCIFTSATGIPEFQRQVTTPNVPKFSSALVSIIEKHDVIDLQVLSIHTLAHLVVNYPTLHRALQQQLNSTALRFLDGSSPKPVPQALVEASSGLYSILHYTGGKVGAAAQWRKSVDDTIQFAWNAYFNLRTTYERAAQQSQPPGDPLVAVPLSIDRLRIAVKVLTDLLQTHNSRPVVVPIGPLVRLCIALLSSSSQGQAEGHIDPTLHDMESSAVPQIHIFSCILIQGLAVSAREALTPHLTQLYYSLSVLLEQKPAACLHLALLNALCALSTHCLGLSDTQIPSRLLRSILPNLTILLTPQSEIQKDVAQAENAQNTKNRKGKKRARGYEGDEVFKVNKEMLCATQVAGDIVLATIDVVQQLLQSSSLSPSIQSLTGRILLALFTSLPHIPPSLVSHDLALHSRLYAKLQRACVTFASDSTSNMSKSLGLVIHASTASDSAASSALWQDIDLLLHPRAPPLVRALPHAEALSLFQAEESQEEVDTRRKMGIATMSEAALSSQQIRTQEPMNGATNTANIPAPPVSGPTPTPTVMSTPISMPPPPLTTTAPQPQAPAPSAASIEHREQVNVDGAKKLANTLALSSIRPPVISAGNPSSAPADKPSPPPRNVDPIPIVRSMIVDDDEDEPIPGIDMGSDSDSE